MEMSDGKTDYWSDFERISGSGIPQSALWLIGNGKLTDLSDPAQVRMVAEERNATVKLMTGKPPAESVEAVMNWITDQVNAYADGAYGMWDIYLYQPETANMQPIITSVPKGPVQDFNGWIKIKKTDLSGKPLSGATFGVFEDEACQSQIGEFTTGSDEWTYKEVQMTKATQTFWVKETSAPTGYVGSSLPYQVVVSAVNNSTKETAEPVNGGAPVKNREPQTPTGIVNKVDQDGNGIGPAMVHLCELDQWNFDGS